MQLADAHPAPNPRPDALPPAMAALASGRLGAQIVRLAQVAAAVHAAQTLNIPREPQR